MKITNMKRSFIYMALCVMTVLATAFVTSKLAQAAKVKFAKKKVTLQVGETYQLTWKGSAKEKKLMKKRKIVWKSSKKKVATVNKKGKIKAKKAGKTKITAKVAGEKYTCHVTVKKSKNKSSAVPKATVKPTQKPVTTATADVVTDAAVAVETAGPGETPLPASTFKPDKYAANVSVSMKKYTTSILLTVKNGNTSKWLDRVDLECVFEDENGYYVDTETVSLKSMKPNETQYVAVPLTDTSTVDKVSVKESNVYVTVTHDEREGTYTDQSSAVQVEYATIDTEMQCMNLKINNPTETEVEGIYICYWKNANGAIFDVETKSFEIIAGDEYTDWLDQPGSIDEETGAFVATAVDCTVSIIAHSFTEFDKDAYLETLGSNISVTNQTIYTSEVAATTQAAITVQNDNTTWVSSVTVDATFYDTNGVEVASGSGVTTALAAGESQTLIMDIGVDVSMIDTDKSTFNYTVTDETDVYTYTSVKDTQITKSASLEDATYTITLKNNLNADVDGVYIVYLYADVAKKTVLQAVQGEFQINASDETDITVDGPSDYDDDGNMIIYAKSYSIEIVAHTVADVVAEDE